jgi:hypothetical protein
MMRLEQIFTVYKSDEGRRVGCEKVTVPVTAGTSSIRSTCLVPEGDAGEVLGDDQETIEATKERKTTRMISTVGAS